MLSEIYNKFFLSPADTIDPQLKKKYSSDFSLDLSILNYYRLRLWVYFLFLLSVMQISTDYFIKDYWTDQQLAAFRILDIFLACDISAST